MKGRGRTTLGLLVFVLCKVAQAQPSHEQPGVGTESHDAAAPELEVPRLREFVAADYPPEARAARIEATVPLRLTLDASGAVTHVEVLERAGNGFDEAALAAASRFRFDPARRNGRPIAARITYGYEFRLEPAPEPAPAAESKSAAPVRAEPQPAPPAPLPPQMAAPPPPKPVEVVVQGEGAGERRRRSAEAVTVVDMQRASRESADLGEVLRRTQGVSLQRVGGLGSSTRFSLNGLTDDQVRFFLDEVPLEFSGFGLGLATVPVNFIDRVEVYRGVVPVRFGSDALGGAINLVSDQEHLGTRAAGSYQVGSFGTYRLTLAGRHQTPAGLFVSANGFGDLSKNDYAIDVKSQDALGRPQRVRVRRFHDGYRARGGSVEVGVLDRPWAKRLSLRVFATAQDKEIQHDVAMVVPYGEVEWGESTAGAILRYEQTKFLLRALRIDLLGGYARRTIVYSDRSRWSYGWDGRRVGRPRTQPVGEVGGDVEDTTYHEDHALGRLNLRYLPAADHQLRLAVAQGYSRRTGENRLFDDSEIRAPQSIERELFSLVTGLEYELDAFDGRFENILFVKDYVYRTTGASTYARMYTPKESNAHRLGAGDALRFRFTDWLWAKASYEYATRLPNANELFGDGAEVLANPDLEPETGHNANLGATLDARSTTAGDLRAEVNGFLRDVDRMIVHLPGSANKSSFLNVNAARSIGVEAAAGWTSPGEYVWLDLNTTWMSFRNTSGTGRFAEVEGDRIPNRPWFFANAAARLQLTSVGAPNDELSLAWNTQYVHEFFRGWESLGAREKKQIVEEQTLHSVALTYLVRAALTVTSTVEVQNVTDAKAYDFFGVQKPGRAVYFKGTAAY